MVSQFDTVQTRNTRNTRNTEVSYVVKHDIILKSSVPNNTDTYIFVRNLLGYLLSETSLWIGVDEAGKYIVSESNNTLTQIIHFLSSVAEVKKIYLLRDADNAMQVWTLSDNLDDLMLDSIYEQELKIIRYFKGSVTLDFHVAPLQDESFIKSGGTILIYSRG